MEFYSLKLMTHGVLQPQTSLVQSDFSLGVMERLGGGRNISVVRGGQVLVHMDMSNQQVDWAL